MLVQERTRWSAPRVRSRLTSVAGTFSGNLGVGVTANGSLSSLNPDIGQITAGYIRNAANTQGLSIGNVQAPGAWTRYISFHNSDYFLFSERVKIDHSGNAWFGGNLDAATGTYRGKVTIRASVTDNEIEFVRAGGSVMAEVNATDAGGSHGVFLKLTSNSAGIDIVEDDFSNGEIGITASAGITLTGPVEVFGAVQHNSDVGFNSTAPISKPTVTGSRGGNAAVASLLSALASYGLITDSTSA